MDRIKEEEKKKPKIVTLRDRNKVEITIGEYEEFKRLYGKPEKYRIKKFNSKLMAIRL